MLPTFETKRDMCCVPKLSITVPYRSPSAAEEGRAILGTNVASKGSMGPGSFFDEILRTMLTVGDSDLEATSGNER